MNELLVDSTIGTSDIAARVLINLGQGAAEGSATSGAAIDDDTEVPIDDDRRGGGRDKGSATLSYQLMRTIDDDGRGGGMGDSNQCR